MANPLRGEKSFEAAGKLWTLRFSTNALCELEESLGYGVKDLQEKMKDDATPKLKTLRTLMWAALTDRHPDITPLQAGNLIDEIGMVEAAALLLAALTRSNEPKKTGSAENPPAGAADKAGLMSSASTSSLVLTPNGSGA